MKKTRKWILLFIAAIIMLIAVIGAVIALPMLSMKPAETGEIPDTGIYVAKNKVNSLYLIETNGGYIVIDAGSDAGAAEQTLSEINIDPSNIKYVLLTHSDNDHVAALNLFPNAEIYISEDELQMIDGTTKRNATGNNSLPNGIEPNSLILLTDGQELRFGEHTIKCIKAPGHTPGSMAYLLDGQYLFSGDAFKADNGIMSIHPFTMDNETSKESIKKLHDISKEIRLVLTAHYGYYTAGDIKLN